MDLTVAGPYDHDLPDSVCPYFKLPGNASWSTWAMEGVGDILK
jgi:hypothetical protein